MKDGEQFFSTQVKPRLAGRVSPGVIKPSRCRKIIVTITDAGAAVRGASVRYNGAAKRTDAHGHVVLSVAKGTRKDSHAITFGDSGYTGGTLHFAPPEPDEACPLLAIDGFVRTLPRRGAVVATRTSRSAHDLFDLRLCLEVGAGASRLARATTSSSLQRRPLGR